MGPAALQTLSVVAVAAGALALLALAVVPSLRRARRRPRVHPPASERCVDPPAPGSRSAEVLALFGALRRGREVGAWRIEEIYEEERGCIPVLLEARGGERLRIDVLRRDPDGPPPPAETEKLALYVFGMEAGSATPEDCARCARALAAALASVGGDPPPWLLTMRARAPLLRGPPPR